MFYFNFINSIDGFQLRDKSAMLVHKTIANYGSCFAVKFPNTNMHQHGSDDVR